MTDRTPRAAKQLGYWFEKYPGFSGKLSTGCMTTWSSRNETKRKDRRDGGEGTTERKKEH